MDAILSTLGITCHLPHISWLHARKRGPPPPPSTHTISLIRNTGELLISYIGIGGLELKVLFCHYGRHTYQGYYMNALFAVVAP